MGQVVPVKARSGSVSRPTGDLLAAALSPYSNGRFRPLTAIPGDARRMVGPAKERTFVPNFVTCQSPAHANASSNAFASLRSGVAKPSVNQP
jgi:hypothetical protein